MYQHFEYLSYKPNIYIFGLKALYYIAQGNALGFCLHVSTRPVRAKVHSLVREWFMYFCPYRACRCPDVPRALPWAME